MVTVVSARWMPWLSQGRRHAPRPAPRTGLDGTMGSDAWLLTPRERGNPATHFGAEHEAGTAWSNGNLVHPLIHGATYFAELVASRIASQRDPRVGHDEVARQPGPGSGPDPADVTGRRSPSAVTLRDLHEADNSRDNAYHRAGQGRLVASDSPGDTPDRGDRDPERARAHLLSL